MVAGVHHIELNVSNLETSKSFYRLLNTFFPEGTIEEFGNSFSWKFESFYLFFNQVKPEFSDTQYHRKRVGLDHMAIELDRMETVKKLEQFLIEHNVSILYPADFYGPNYF